MVAATGARLGRAGLARDRDGEVAKRDADVPPGECVAM